MTCLFRQVQFHSNLRDKKEDGDSLWIRKMEREEAEVKLCRLEKLELKMLWVSWVIKEIYEELGDIREKYRLEEKQELVDFADRVIKEKWDNTAA